MKIFTGHKKMITGSLSVTSSEVALQHRKTNRIQPNVNLNTD